MKTTVYTKCKYTSKGSSRQRNTKHTLTFHAKDTHTHITAHTVSLIHVKPFPKSYNKLNHQHSMYRQVKHNSLLVHVYAFLFRMIYYTTENSFRRLTGIKPALWLVGLVQKIILAQTSSTVLKGIHWNFIHVITIKRTEYLCKIIAELCILDLPNIGKKLFVVPQLAWWLVCLSVRSAGQQNVL